MPDKPTVEATEAANARRREEDRRMVENIRELAKQYPLDLVMPKAPDLKTEEYKKYVERVVLAGFGLYLDANGHIRESKRTMCHNVLGPEEKVVVDYEKLELRVAEHFLGVDFATNPDRTVAQELVRVPRDKAKELLYGLCYGAGPHHIHDAMVPNKNGDVFSRQPFNAVVQGVEPLPHIQPGDPLSSKPLNDLIDRVNDLCDLFILGHNYCVKHKDISMGCSVKPDPCPACDHEEKERLKTKMKEIPFISHEDVESMRKEMTSSRYIREYMGMWPPLEEEPKPFPGETEGTFARRMREWKREQREKQDQINYKAEPMPARKEDNMPGVVAMGMKEVEKHKLMQEAAQKDFSVRGGRALLHSPGVEMLLEAQRKAKPKKLVEKAIQQNEETLATKELKKVTEGVNWKPGHCRICGHANGCHHPRPQEPQGIEEPCEHLFLTRVKGAIATELGANMADGMTCAIYACRDCHKIVARIPLGSLPK